MSGTKLSDYMGAITSNTVRAIKPTSGLEPIPDEEKPCHDPCHFPPGYMVIPHGMQHRYRCPSCGHESITRATQVTL